MKQRWAGHWGYWGNLQWANGDTGLVQSTDWGHHWSPLNTGQNGSGRKGWDLSASKYSTDWWHNWLFCYPQHSYTQSHTQQATLLVPLVSTAHCSQFMLFLPSDSSVSSVLSLHRFIPSGSVVIYNHQTLTQLSKLRNLKCHLIPCVHPGQSKWWMVANGKKGLSSKAARGHTRILRMLCLWNRMFCLPY